jgi:hypothetical protein
MTRTHLFFDSHLKRLQSSDPLHTKMPPPPVSSAHGLYRTLTSYWMAHFSSMKKSTKVQHYFGLYIARCWKWIFQIFYSRADLKRTIVAFLNPGYRKRLGFVHIQTVCRRSRRIGWIFVWSGLELWSLFKYSRLKFKKSKTYSSWCTFQGLSNGTTLMQI